MEVDQQRGGLSSGFMSEDRFWEINQEAIVDEIGMSQFQYLAQNKLLRNQQTGVQNLPLLFVPEQNIQTNTPELTMRKEEAERLLREHVELREAYESRDFFKVSDKEFWREFLVKNNQFQTLVFGGNNPIFIPFFTNEKEYEDLKNNLKELRLKYKAQMERSRQASNIDVDFQSNLMDAEHRAPNDRGTS